MLRKWIKERQRKAAEKKAAAEAAAAAEKKAKEVAEAEKQKLLEEEKATRAEGRKESFPLAEKYLSLESQAYFDFLDRDTVKLTWDAEKEFIETYLSGEASSERSARDYELLDSFAGKADGYRPITWLESWATYGHWGQDAADGQNKIYKCYEQEGKLLVQEAYFGFTENVGGLLFFCEDDDLIVLAIAVITCGSDEADYGDFERLEKEDVRSLIDRYSPDFWPLFSDNEKERYIEIFTEANHSLVEALKRPIVKRRETNDYAAFTPSEWLEASITGVMSARTYNDASKQKLVDALASWLKQSPSGLSKTQQNHIDTIEMM
tara:strand:- start:1477 stop:2439 length:963 start_codon:yes stop_codon:yes gene_type:complete